MKENKYYVYLHRNLSGVVVYVGKGTRSRVTSNSNRSPAWREATKGGFTYQILKNDMSNREAMLLEESLIEIYRNTVVNSTSSKIVKELDFEVLNEVFYYDETSPSGLRWKVDRLKNKGAKLFSAGDVAGNKRFMENGTPRCWILKFQGVPHVVHRIVWVLLNGSLDPDLVIDHLDGNAFNNNITNLKPKTHADNARNRGYNKTQTGVIGVTKRIAPGNIINFRASWKDANGKEQCRNFSTRKYGYEEAFRLACEVRENKIKELRALGFDYTDRHLVFRQ